MFKVYDIVFCIDKWEAFDSRNTWPLKDINGVLHTKTVFGNDWCEVDKKYQRAYEEYLVEQILLEEE